MQAPAYRTIVDAYYEVSPYVGIAPGEGTPTPPGWGSDNPIFRYVIDELKPDLIVEVGSWMGASAIHMANLATARGLSTAIVCIDTWLGSVEHWRDNVATELGLVNGYPTMHRKFLANVVAAGHVDTIIPIPQTSSGGAHMLLELGLTPQLVYIDGDHEGSAVYTDLTNYWQLLTPGGILFGDDYTPSWPGVVNAVQLFARNLGLTPHLLDEKWMLRKP